MPLITPKMLGLAGHRKKVLFNAALTRARDKLVALQADRRSKHVGSDSQRIAAFKLSVKMEKERDRHAASMRLAREKLEAELQPVTDESLKETARLMRSITLPDPSNN